MKEDKCNERTLEGNPTGHHPDRDDTEVPDNVRVELRVAYGEAEGRELTLDLFASTERPSWLRPAIIFLHGGSWCAGSPSQFHFHGAYLASRRNFFAASVGYRLSPEAPFPAALQDVKCAVRWVRSRCNDVGVDPERIAVCGGSAGAHLASMMLTTAGISDYEGVGGNGGYNSHVNLGILFNGMFDLWDLVKRRSLVDPMRQFLGGSPEEVPGRYDELSTIHRIHEDVPSMLLLHGTGDTCVSCAQSVAFHEKLRSVGVCSEIELYEGEPHGWFNHEPDRTITTERMERFLIEQFDLRENESGVAR